MTVTDEMLRIDHVSVHFGGGNRWLSALGLASPLVKAVDDVSLVVPRAASLGIVGESGSGKSTLMRAVMGIVPPTSGSIQLRGHALERHRYKADRRAIQMVFQDPGTALNPAHRVGASLEELLAVHRLVPRGQERHRALELFDAVKLPHALFDERPAKLSGGQRQRVAIAKALALEPEVLIADEATSALDVAVQASVLDLLLDLRRERGITLIFVTHDLELVRYACDSAVVLRHGRLVEQGDVRQVLDHPQDPYTQELIAASPTLPTADGRTL